MEGQTKMTQPVKGEKMKITQMTDKHLLNRIAFLERKSKERPSEHVYMGDSDYAEQAVDEENRRNENLAEDIEAHIRYMNKVAKRRKLL